MAAGLVAESRRRARARAPASPLLQPASRAGQAKQPWAEALLPGRRAPPRAWAAQAGCGRGPADFQRAGPVAFE